MKKSREPINNFNDIRKVLARYVSPLGADRGAYTLERMNTLMESLGNPQNKYKVIHVAGTSGKTSTCYYLAALLKEAGKKTGLTVSPHIDEVNERVQIDMKPLAEGRFCKEFAIFHNLIEKSGIRPTYFEVLTAFAFWEFSRQNCEYVVVEVGLGGLLDATNVITNKNKLNVITDIGMDHEEVLGKTKGNIASQKAGIIKPYNKVICYEQDEEIIDVIRETASQQNAELHEVWPLKNKDLPRSLPLFQRRNWYLALAAFNLLRERDGLVELSEASLASSTSVYIPARMEIHEVQGAVLILDGSHNQQKLEALVRSIKFRYPKQKFTILVSFVTSKQMKITNCLQVLLPLCEKLFITSFHTENNEKVSVDPFKIVAACEDLNFTKWGIIDDPTKAFKKLIGTKGKNKLVTGSFYLLNHIRPVLNK